MRGVAGIKAILWTSAILRGVWCHGDYQSLHIINSDSLYLLHHTFIILTLNGLEGHVCPSLVKDGKDIYVPLL